MTDLVSNYKELYIRALMNSKKKKSTVNWAHVANHGVGSARAARICVDIGIDPYGYEFKRGKTE